MALENADAMPPRDLYSLGGSYILVLDKVKPSIRVGNEKGGGKMKKLLSFMFIIAIIVTIALLPGEGYSKPKWILYDDFESGNLERWIVEPEGAPITNDGGKAKVEITEETPWTPWTPYFLIINMAPEQLQEIKGIKVTVRIEKVEGNEVGDILAGIGAIIAKWKYIENCYVWDNLYIQAGYLNIFCGLPIIHFGTTPPTFMFDIFNGDFGDFLPTHLINKNITISMIFSLNKFTYEVEDFGTITRDVTGELDPSDYRHFRGLATVSGSEDDRAIVYFDDVYILK